MLGIGDGFFIETLTQSTARILHPAKILGTTDVGYVAEIEEASVSLNERAEFFIYFEVKTKFVKQAATIEAVYYDGSSPNIEFVTVGEPMSAESRQHFRVSTVTSELTCSLGGKSGCKLVNVSAIGFSALTTTRHDIGSTVDASVSYEGKAFAGRVCVQSIRSMGGSQIRYGLHCVDGTGELEGGLRQMTMAIQRKQLRRLSRAT